MDRAYLETTLAQVDVHIEQSEMHVGRQHEIVADAERLGGDHSLSALLLETFEMCLTTHKEHRARLLRAIDAVQWNSNCHYPWSAQASLVLEGETKTRGET